MIRARRSKTNESKTGKTITHCYRRALIICYIMLVWFVISFVTNIIDPLMPTIISDFHLSLGLAGFLPFSFFWPMD